MKNYIDQNSKNVGFGLVHGSKTLNAFTVTPADNMLRIEIIPVSSAGSAIAPRNINIDENTHQVAAAVTDDGNELITPLTVTDIVGLPCLRVDVI